MYTQIARALQRSECLQRNDLLVATAAVDHWLDSDVRQPTGEACQNVSGRDQPAKTTKMTDLVARQIMTANCRPRLVLRKRGCDTYSQLKKRNAKGMEHERIEHSTFRNFCLAARALQSGRSTTELEPQFRC
jgi:hypothetical protein